VPSEPTFAQLVSLACHDLRTPLATVHGFARTLDRVQPLEAKTRSYVGMIEEATVDMIGLLERLALVARIEGGRYEPTLRSADSLALAEAAAGRLGPKKAGVDGSGAQVSVDPEPIEDALASLALCALRHGGLERVELLVSSVRVDILPTTPESAPVLRGEDFRDVGAVAARRVIEAQGGTMSVDAKSVAVTLPA
jgi:signal transduction histidine kinase